MNKDKFYMIGFYGMICLVLGFIIGASFNFHYTKEVIQVPIVKDTVSVDTISKKTSKVDNSINDKIILKELQRQKVSFPYVVLAQAKLETGHYTSDVLKQHNNLFGLRGAGDYYHFNHWKDSIKYYKEHVQSRYKGGSYYVFLEDIGYSEDKDYIKKLKEIV